MVFQASSSTSHSSAFLSFTHGVLEARNGTAKGMSFCVIYYPNITTTYPSEKEQGVCIYMYFLLTIYNNI
jgi:hypothetical protein